MDASIQALINLLQLEPLPGEGGMYRQTYRSRDQIPLEHLPQRYPSRRFFSSAIYYLLTDEPDSFSALHRLLSDEVYHFYLGDPIEMLLLLPGGRSQRVLLGQDIFHGQQLQFVVPHGAWQGSRLLTGGRYALLGTTMAPGYESDEFVLGSRAELIRQYPDQADLIRALTRG